MSERAGQGKRGNRLPREVNQDDVSVREGNLKDAIRRARADVSRSEQDLKKARKMLRELEKQDHKLREGKRHHR